MTKTVVEQEWLSESPPLCDCHGEPKRWHKRAKGLKGGFWECRVSHREREREWYRRHPEVRREQQRRFYRKNREAYLKQAKNEYRRGYAVLTRFKTFKGCLVCGYREHPAALVFHHREPNQKTDSVSAFLRSGLNAVREELAKCDVLCANCHAITHYGDGANDGD